MTLSDDDLRRVAEQFGVSELQVRRDHLITHLLAVLSASPLADELVFYGGTTLPKTHLDQRQSADRYDVGAAQPG
ncbi:hypothetical protein ACFQ46_05040 [Kineococcus sp. GCM10028916]|uniref:hypothetical protein n=1 Tax=Kineococcus sp. GCM10028916 TaxID=3273394 RepID=UPI003635D082